MQDSGADSTDTVPGGSRPVPQDDIIVTGSYDQTPWWYIWGITSHGAGYFAYNDLDFSTYNNDAGFITVPGPNDEDSIDLWVNIGRPLTAKEKIAIEHFQQRLIDAKFAVDTLPDNAFVRMSDGSIVKASELKTIFAKADFIINDSDFKWDGVHVGYQNGTRRGEADYNGGDPIVSFNIDTVSGYDDVPSGLSFMIFHELGHMTPEGRREPLATTETFANDVAHALQKWQGIDPAILHEDTSYGPTPTFFEVPQSSGGGGPRNPGSDVPNPDDPGPPSGMTYAPSESGESLDQNWAVL